MPWTKAAACKNVKPEIFFDPDRVETAISICQCCPVMQECLEEALLNSEYGVRGGLTEEERRRYFIPKMIGQIKVFLTEEDSDPVSIRVFKD